MTFLYRAAVLVVAFFAPLAAYAQDSEDPGRFLGSLKFLGAVSVQGLTGRLIKGLFGLAGTFALVMFLFGGFTIMTAQGSEEKVKKGKSMIINAAMGLLAMFASYSLLNFIIKALSKVV